MRFPQNGRIFSTGVSVWDYVENSVKRSVSPDVSCTLQKGTDNNSLRELSPVDPTAVPYRAVYRAVKLSITSQSIRARKDVDRSGPILLL